MVTRQFEGIEIVLEEVPSFTSILSKVLLTLGSSPRGIEIILLDFTVKNRKWLCIGLYKPPSQKEKYFLDHPSKTLKVS